jgi:hypothetical protein
VQHLVEVGNGPTLPNDAMPGNVPLVGLNPNPGGVFRSFLANGYTEQNPAFIGALPFGFAEQE